MPASTPRPSPGAESPPPRSSQDSAISFGIDKTGRVVMNAEDEGKATENVDASGLEMSEGGLPTGTAVVEEGRHASLISLLEPSVSERSRSNTPQPIPDLFYTTPTDLPHSAEANAYNPVRAPHHDHLATPQQIDSSFPNGTQFDIDFDAQEGDENLDIGSVEGKVLPHPFLNETSTIHFILTLPTSSSEPGNPTASASTSAFPRSAEEESKYDPVVRSILGGQEEFETEVRDVKYLMGLKMVGDKGISANVGVGYDVAGTKMERVIGTLGFTTPHDAERVLACYQPMCLLNATDAPSLRLSSRAIRSATLHPNPSSLSTSRNMSPANVASVYGQPNASSSQASTRDPSNASHRILRELRPDTAIDSIFTMIRPWGSLKNLQEVEVSSRDQGFVTGAKGGEREKVWRVEFWRENEASRWESDWNGNDVAGDQIHILNLSDKHPVSPSEATPYATLHQMSNNMQKVPFFDNGLLDRHLQPQLAPKAKPVHYTCMQAPLTDPTVGPGNTRLAPLEPSCPNVDQHSRSSTWSSCDVLPNIGLYQPGATTFDMQAEPAFGYASYYGATGYHQNVAVGPDFTSQLNSPVWTPSPWMCPSLDPYDPCAFDGPGSPTFGMAGMTLSTPPLTPPHQGLDGYPASPWQGMHNFGQVEPAHGHFGIDRTAASQIGLRARSFSEGATDTVHEPNQTSSSRAPKFSLKGNPLRPCLGQTVQVAEKYNAKGRRVNSYIDLSNLFISNLDKRVTSNQLFASFHMFGRIVSAVVMRDPKGVSKGYGFVSFMTPHEASSAMVAMQNAVLGSLPIAIRWHEPRSIKVDRDAQLSKSSSPSPIPRSRATSQQPTRFPYNSTEAPTVSSQPQQPAVISSVPRERSPVDTSPTKSSARMQSILSAAGLLSLPWDHLETDGDNLGSLQTALSPDCPAEPHPTTLEQLVMLPANVIWQIMERKVGTSLLNDLQAEYSDPDARKYTKTWLEARAPQTLGGRRRAVATKLAGFLPPWGLTSVHDAPTIANAVLQKEDPDSVIMLLNCYPDVARSFVGHRVGKKRV